MALRKTPQLTLSRTPDDDDDVRNVSAEHVISKEHVYNVHTAYKVTFSACYKLKSQRVPS